MIYPTYIAFSAEERHDEIYHLKMIITVTMWMEDGESTRPTRVRKASHKTLEMAQVRVN